jgi:hypothetical protein
LINLNIVITIEDKVIMRLFKQRPDNAPWDLLRNLIADGKHDVAKMLARFASVSNPEFSNFLKSFGLQDREAMADTLSYIEQHSEKDQYLGKFRQMFSKRR